MGMNSQMDPKTKQLIDAASSHAIPEVVGQGDGATVACEFIHDLIRSIKEQDKRARHAEEERDAFGKRIAELEAQVAGCQYSESGYCGACDVCCGKTKTAQSKRIAELETSNAALRIALQELAKDWDNVAGDTELFGPGYREAVSVCSESIKELIVPPSPRQTPAKQ